VRRRWRGSVAQGASAHFSDFRRRPRDGGMRLTAAVGRHPRAAPPKHARPWRAGVSSEPWCSKIESDGDLPGPARTPGRRGPTVEAAVRNGCRQRREGRSIRPGGAPGRAGVRVPARSSRTGQPAQPHGTRHAARNRRESLCQSRRFDVLAGRRGAAGCSLTAAAGRLPCIRTRNLGAARSAPAYSAPDRAAPRLSPG